MSKECLLKKFELLKKQYVKAFRAKLYDVYKRLGTELFNLANKLKAEFGIQFNSLGLTDDAEYIIRSVQMVAQNPVSEHADAIFVDAKRVACETCNGKCEEPTKLSTTQGTGVRSMLEEAFSQSPSEDKSPAPISDVPVRRGMGFENMFEAAFSKSENSTSPVEQRWSDFCKEILEEVFPESTSEHKSSVEQSIVRGIGFRSMLEATFPDSESATASAKKPVLHCSGLRNMLDVAFPDA